MKKVTRTSKNTDLRRSAICGEGYGNCHLWVRGRTAQVGSGYPQEKRTQYTCANCDAGFYHYYDLVPDIFEAMEKAEVKNSCP